MFHSYQYGETLYFDVEIRREVTLSCKRWRPLRFIRYSHLYS